MADFDFLGPRKLAILQYTIWLTLKPGAVTAGHLVPLREAGLSDAEIHDVVQVVCCFSFMNRLADGLGVSILEGREALAIELLGAEALREHRAWSRDAAGGIEHTSGE